MGALSALSRADATNDSKNAVNEYDHRNMALNITTPSCTARLAKQCGAFTLQVANP